MLRAASPGPTPPAPPLQEACFALPHRSASPCVIAPSISPHTHGGPQRQGSDRRRAWHMAGTQSALSSVPVRTETPRLLPSGRVRPTLRSVACWGTTGESWISSVRDVHCRPLEPFKDGTWPWRRGRLLVDRLDSPAGGAPRRTRAGRRVLCGGVAAPPSSPTGADGERSRDCQPSCDSFVLSAPHLLSHL